MKTQKLNQYNVRIYFKYERKDPSTQEGSKSKNNNSLVTGTKAILSYSLISDVDRKAEKTLSTTTVLNAKDTHVKCNARVFTLKKFKDEHARSLPHEVRQFLLEVEKECQLSKARYDFSKFTNTNKLAITLKPKKNTLTPIQQVNEIQPKKKECLYTTVKNK